MRTLNHFTPSRSSKVTASSHVGSRSPRPGRIHRRSKRSRQRTGSRPPPSCAAAGRVTRDSRAGPRSDAGAPWGARRRLPRASHAWGGRSAGRTARLSSPAAAWCACGALRRVGHGPRPRAPGCRAPGGGCRREQPRAVRCNGPARPHTARALDRQRSVTVGRVPLGQGQQADA